MIVLSRREKSSYFFISTKPSQPRPIYSSSTLNILSLCVEKRILSTTDDRPYKGENSEEKTTVLPTNHPAPAAKVYVERAPFPSPALSCPC